MLRQASNILWLTLIVALMSACTALPAPMTAPDTAASPATSEGADEGEMAESRGLLRVPHFLPFGGAENLDPASPAEFNYANFMLYDRLVALDENGIPTPELAVEWSANEDATEWAFTLREGVTFHDGSAFDSADVAYTIAHLLDPATESPRPERSR